MNTRQNLKNMLMVGMVALSLLLVAMYLQAYLTQLPSAPSPAGVLVGTPEPSVALVGTPGLVFGQPIQGEIAGDPNPSAVAQFATDHPNYFQTGDDPDQLFAGYRITPGLDPEWQRLLDTRQNTTTLYGVLQFEVPFDPGYLIKMEQLKTIGVQLDADRFNHETSSTLAIIPPQALPIIANWVETGKLRYAGPIPLEIRVSNKVWEVANTNPHDPLPVSVWLFELPVEDTAQMTYLYPNVIIYQRSAPIINLTGWVDPVDLPALAALPQVRAINYRTVEESCLTVGFDRYCGIEPTPSR